MTEVYFVPAHCSTKRHVKIKMNVVKKEKLAQILHRGYTYTMPVLCCIEVRVHSRPRPN